jgi:hypothetical protein
VAGHFHAAFGAMLHLLQSVTLFQFLDAPHRLRDAPQVIVFNMFTIIQPMPAFTLPRKAQQRVFAGIWPRQHFSNRRRRPACSGHKDNIHGGFAWVRNRLPISARLYITSRGESFWA